MQQELVRRLMSLPDRSAAMDWQTYQTEDRVLEAMASSEKMPFQLKIVYRHVVRLESSGLETADANFYFIDPRRSTGYLWWRKKARIFISLTRLDRLRHGQDQLTRDEQHFAERVIAH